MQNTSNGSNSMSDVQLIAEFQLTSSSDVFAELYRRYYKKVQIYCYKSLGNGYDAEDLAQDIMVRAFEKLGTLNNPQLWVAWLFSIARNMVLNHHKQLTRAPFVSDEAEYPFSLSENEEDIELRLEKESKLKALPALLETAEARILKLKYMEGKSIEELCLEMHMNESAVKMKLLRARQRVIKMYQQQRAMA